MPRINEFLRTLCIAALTLSLPAAGLCSGPDTLWTRTCGTAFIDRGRSICEENGYVIAGHTWRPGVFSSAYFVKFDVGGAVEWTKTYDGAENDIKSIARTSDGFIAAGYYVDSVHIDHGMYLMKLDWNGDTLWTRVYGDTMWECANSVLESHYGGYLLAGDRRGGEVWDMYAVRTDDLGDTLWTRVYGGDGQDIASSAVETYDHGFALAGGTRSFGATFGDFYLVRTDEDGDTLWMRTYGGDFGEHAYCMRETSDGGFIVVGYTDSYGAGNGDFYLVRTSEDGDTLWTRVYGGSGSDVAYSVAETPDGGFMVVGGTASFGSGLQDVYIVRTDANGDSIWTWVHGGSMNDFAHSIILGTSNVYLLAGYTQSWGAGDADVYFIAFQEDLSSVTGERAPIDALRLSSAAPNPFRGQTRVEYEIPRNSSIDLVVYNTRGQEVRRLVKSYRSAGRHAVIWDGRDNSGEEVPSGVYFLKFSDGHREINSKVVLIR